VACRIEIVSATGCRRLLSEGDGCCSSVASMYRRSMTLAPLLALLATAACGDDAPGADAMPTPADAAVDGSIDAVSGDPDGAVDAAPDAAPDAAVEPEVDGGSALIRFSNVAEVCNIPSLTYPLAGEEGHLAAARLKVPAGGVHVERVVYTLISSDSFSVCSSNVAHELILFKGTGTVPPESPEFLQVIPVPAEETEISDRRVIDLPVSVDVPDGEDLYIALRTGGIYPHVTCPATCYDNAIQDRNYWSNAVDAPYPWAQMSNWSDINFIYTAYGTPLAK
jgi:hypothetical protein